MARQFFSNPTIFSFHRYFAFAMEKDRRNAQNNILETGA